MPRPTLRACRVLSTLLGCWLATSGAVHGQNKLAPVAPFLDEQTLVVGRVDLERIDPAAVAQAVATLLPPAEAAAQQLAMIGAEWTARREALARAGIGELYCVVSLADVPQGPPFIVAPTDPRSDPAAAAAALRELLGAGQQTAVLHGMAVWGTEATIARLRTLQPAPRPAFSQAFEQIGAAAVQVVFSPTDDTRRVVREMLPRLPDEVGGGSGRVLADGVQWASVAANLPPKLSLEVTIQSPDADSAAALRGILVSGLQWASQHEAVRREFPRADELAPLFTPRLANDQLRLTIDDQHGGAAKLLALLAQPVQAARAAAFRSQSMNNLKQMGLALHNYHDTHGRFPPRAIRGAAGKPLLSWRVAVLPYLEGQPLYEQFKLDEPWDSEHNLKLVEQMPAIFASPNLPAGLRAQGMTTYLAPITARPAGEAGPVEGLAMVFDDPQGTSMRKIVDGTSNTIALVEAHPRQAVIWTRPDDLPIDLEDPLAALRDQPHDGFHALLCDGSVLFITQAIERPLLIRLLQMNDRQPVHWP